MKVTGTIKDVSFDYQMKNVNVTLQINERKTFTDFYEEFKDTKLSIDLKKYRNQRSLDANAYYWSLINQLSNVLMISNEELHLKFLKEYGQILLVPLSPEQKPNGYFKYFEKYKDTVIDGKEATYYKVYKPSSEMDSKEFWMLIKGLETECKEWKIPTLEDKEFERMMQAYDS